MNDNNHEHFDGDAQRRAVALGLLGVGGLLAAQRAQAAYTGKTLVVLFQRFAADGLMELVPYGDPKWTEYRVADARPDSVVSIGNPYWGLHPRFGDDVDGSGSFKSRFWDAGQLALIPGTFVPDGDSRSHFSAQADMEVAAFGANVGTDIGFCSRILNTQPHDPEALLRGVSLSSYLPDMARGDYSFVSLSSLDGFTLASRHAPGIVSPLLATFPTDETGASSIALKTAQALDEVPGIAQSSPPIWAPANYTEYLLHNAARLIRARAGAQIITLDVGGWDLHTGVKQGMDTLLGELSRGLVRFRNALVHNSEDLWNNVNVVVMTEFGRTLRSNTPNGNQLAGTDHGWGSLMMVLGGNVKGGIYDSKWPAADASGSRLAAFEGINAVHNLNDYRQALAEVARRTLGLPLEPTATQPMSLRTVFPGAEPWQFPQWKFHNFLPALGT